MTYFIVDVSRHQVERDNPLDLARAKAAGMNAVNIQLDRGRQDDVLPGWALDYANRARDLGMGISTYRWLDNRISGEESAKRAYQRILALGGPYRMAHAVDCEENATESNLRAYVATMQQLLGRKIVIYSGRWWMKPRGWNIRSMCPYLWAAPSNGYLGTYPGDTSAHWGADYGGHTALDIMQYAVAPLPGTGDCSLSAVRDMNVWTALTGTGSSRMTYADPALIAARNYLISMGWPGASVGIVGDPDHKATGGYHCGNDWLDDIGRLYTDYSKRESPRDRPGSNAATALDIGGVSDATLWSISSWLVAQCQAGAPDTYDIREIIYWHAPTNTIRRWDRLGIHSGGGWSHRTHTHLSYHRDSEGRTKTGLFYRYYNPPVIPAGDEEDENMQFYAPSPDGTGPRWAVMTGGYWVEYDAQSEGTATALQGGNYTTVDNSVYVSLRKPFERAARVLDGVTP